VHLEVTEVTQAHRLDCEATAADCRFVVQSEDEDEAVELSKTHMREVHGTDYTDEELRSEHLQIV
jgi:predicted small metal-binding protein